MLNNRNNKPDGSDEMLAVVFMDLDDTVFQTQRKCGAGPLRPAALDSAGNPSSYFNPEQYFLLKLLEGRSLVIPTTARNQEAFSRVQINFDQGAILDHGGIILQPSGDLDHTWHERMGGLTRQASPMLMEIKHLAEDIISREGLTCRVRIISDHGLDFYVLIKNSNFCVSELAVLRDHIEGSWGLGSGVWIHSNDNNLAILPEFLNKGEAVSYFLQTHIRPVYPQLPIIGMGDSSSDLSFMRLCNFMLIPSHSQLAENFSW